MIVAVALFAVVMLVCVGALLALVNANRKAQALQSVMNNLNIALDGMVRSVRMGSVYHCGNGDATVAQDCSTGDTAFAFKPFCETAPCPSYLKFSYENERIMKSEDGQTPFPITAPEVSIEDMKFYVVGTTRGDDIQPKVVIVIKGSAGAEGSKARTTFHIQATAVQRVLDL